MRQKLIPLKAVIEWALALESFIRNRLRGHKIVLIGHSVGAAAM